MTKTLINLTISIVIQELESILDTYPHHPYQEAFANPDIRQTLVAYILSRIPNQYITVDAAEKPEFNCSESMCRSLERSLHLESVIRQGIEKVLGEAEEDIHRYIPEAVDPNLAASHWFG
ncbi:hypothetical protein [Nostoc cycadae]|uniref:Late competence development ComFB family protein n=1 Tax=Nostoc cycadae WK-1 TaxID=1861711 RepID=A0A2H6LDD9_9NOSO|nr:hypothetical protein [Nostoc cycadae]GBE91229.1 hypothetical protein NCWK1_0953 [Nostoc cycadae WK-1]